MRDTLAHHSKLNWLTSSHCANNLLSDAGVHILWMEGYLQVQIRVWIHVALGWRDCEVLLEFRGVPLEVCLHITKVTHLESLGKTTVVHDLTERDNLIHDLSNCASVPI